ncbi:MAG: hypothetical protein KTR24_05530 [Saprospiraceae bacterium]|nr:hypothetical protein [Saprospiraceae bacterium]
MNRCLVNNLLSLLVLLWMLLQTSCSAVISSEVSRPNAPSWRGLSFVAPPEPFAQNPMPAVLSVHANCIAVIPYGYTNLGQTTVRFNMKNRQWWGEREEGVERTIALAKESGIRVMLKPQVWGHNLWTGDLDFQTEAEWESWQNDYRRYILFYASLAERMEVDLFCIGTEFKIAAVKREDFWRSLIAEVKQVYAGRITYASNWDHYQNIPFWDALDVIGINAYFPLLDAHTPAINDLLKSWQPWLEEIDAFHKAVDRPIVFTEFGYLSVDGCAHKTWELEDRVTSTPINQKAQANALSALFEALESRFYWEGGFIWKWFPNMRGHEGYPERDYTPQGKLGEAVLRDWYLRWGQ